MGEDVHVTPLATLEPGSTAIVTSLPNTRALASQLVSMGFTLGAEVTMIDNRRRGPVLVQVRGTRVALGRNQARVVAVRPVESAP